ncbi:MAG: autotransporter domain-containing protein [Proteobacteria bacterium]|nr:autotransporter domain-containing protein [Pseudomonadota bacterium]
MRTCTATPADRRYSMTVRIVLIALLAIMALCTPGLGLAQASNPHLSTTIQLTANTDPNGLVLVGDTLTYTVNALNDGNVALTGVQLTSDAAPLTPGSFSCPSVAVGASCVMVATHVVTSADASAGQIYVHVVASATPTLNGGTDSGYLTAVSTPAGAGMIIGSLTNNYVDVDHSGTITAGDTIQVIGTVINTGSVVLTNVQISQPQTNPSSFTCPSISPGNACQGTGTYTFTAADIAAGQVTFTSSATSTQVPGPEVFSNLMDNFGNLPGGGYNLVRGGGEGQVGTPGTTLPVPLTAQVIGPTGPQAGQTVNFKVVSGSGHTTTQSAVSDINGNVSTQLVLGSTPGAVVVIFGIEGQNVLFTAYVNAPAVPPVLSIVSGNNQVVPVNTASAPLIVQLTHNGAPVSGVTINWSGNNVHLTSPTSVTDSNGKASNTATVIAAGAASVSAVSVSPAAGPVSFALNGDLTSISGLTPPEKAIAGALNNACPALAGLSTLTPAQQDLLAQCQALGASASVNPTQAANALNQMLPRNTLIESNASVLVSTAQFDNINARLAALRSGMHGASFAGLAFTSPDGALSIGRYGETALGLNEAPKTDDASTGSGFDRWGFFVSGSFGWGSADPRTATPGYGFQTSGLTAGVDYRVSDNWVLGGSAGYAKYSSTVDTVGGGLDTHGWSLSGYTTFYQKDDWYIDGVLTWTSSTYDINRRIVYSLAGLNVDQTATSNSGGNTIAGALTIGKDFHSGGWLYGPYFRGAWSHTSFDAYQETVVAGQSGSGLGLAVESRSLKSLSTVLGAKVNYSSSQNWGVLGTHAELEWDHEYEDNPDTVNASFLADPTATVFQIKGDSVDTNYFRFGLGLSFTFTQGRSAFVYYQKTLGISGLTQDNIAAGFRMEF